MHIQIVSSFVALTNNDAIGIFIGWCFCFYRVVSHSRNVEPEECTGVYTQT